VAGDVQGSPAYVVFKAFAALCHQYLSHAFYYLQFIIDHFTPSVYHKPLFIDEGFQQIVYSNNLAKD
jgi:hypothetical protein